jgi:hypothetical protein
VKFLGSFVFGALALLATVFPLAFGPFGATLLIAALPLWILFFVFLVRALKP